MDWLVKWCFSIFIITFCINSDTLAGEWNSTELCTIKWEGDGYALFSKSVLKNSGTPGISSDDYILTARGPETALVDMSGNIIVSSDEL